MICNNYAFSERRKRQSLEKKIHQIGSNIFEPVPSGLSLSLSLIFLPTKLLVRDACEGVTKEEKEEEEEDKWVLKSHLWKPRGTWHTNPKNLYLRPHRATLGSR